MINQQNEQLIATRPKRRVAILSAHGDVMHERVAHRLYQLFLQPMFNDDMYEPVLWQSYFAKEAVQSKINQIKMQKFDLVLVLGENLSLAWKKDRTQVGYAIPTVYLGISCPDRLGLVESLDKSGDNSIAIVADDISEVDLVQNIIRFKPYIKKIALPYCSTSGGGLIASSHNYIRLSLEKAGIEVYAQPIASADEGKAFLRSVISQVDSVFINEGCWLTSCLSDIALLCWENKTILFAGGGEEVIDLGAACAYGGSVTVCADKTYEVVTQLLENQIDWSCLPVVPVEYQRFLIVNESIAVQCGLPQSFISDLKNQDKVLVWRRWVARPI